MAKDLVIYGENGQILECNFNRVDFNDPNSILNYGLDIQGEIGKILESTSKISEFTYDIEIDEKDVDALATFDQTLDKNEKKQNGVGASLANIGRSILAKLGVEKFQDMGEKYSLEYSFREYCSMIETVVQGEEEMKQSSLSNIKLRQEIKEELKPLIKQLEQMLEVGTLDKTEYDKVTEELKKQEQTVDIQNEIQVRTLYSNIFGDKLYNLQKTINMYKEQVLSYDVQQQTDMQIVMAAESFIKDTSPILKAQGSVMIFNRDQQKKLAFQQNLIDASNQAVANNAKDLQLNAQQAVDLMLNNGITVETLKVVETSLRNGIQIFKDGQVKKKELVKKNTEALADLNATLGTYQEELNQLAGSDEAIAGLLENQSTGSKTLTKRRGRRK